MDRQLESFLRLYSPVVKERSGAGSILRLEVTTYLCHAAPPQEFVSGAAAVVIRGDEVLVMRGANGTGTLPRGRRKTGEDVEACVRRVVREQAGWRLAEARLNGVRHCRDLEPKQHPLARPSPDSLEAVFCGRPATYLREEAPIDGSGFECEFVPFSRAEALCASASERLFLEIGFDLTRQAGGIGAL